MSGRVALVEGEFVKLPSTVDLYAMDLHDTEDTVLVERGPPRET